MHRTVRTLTTVGLTFTLSFLAGTQAVSAQEMDHGRRPVSRELQSNLIRTQNSIDTATIGKIRS